jgi:hypothetical protein
MNLEDVAIVITGLTDESRPTFEIVAKCRRCEATLAVRQYSATEPVVPAEIAAGAIADGLKTTAHQCTVQ